MSPAFSWLALGTMTIIVGCLTTSSSTDPAQDTPIDSEVAVSDVLAAVGPSVVLPALDAFLAELDLLEQAITDWESSLFTSDEEASRSAVQQQWSSAMLVWQ